MLINIYSRGYWALLWPILCRPRKIPLRTTMQFHVDALEPEELACLEKTKDKDRKIESLEKICLGAMNASYSGLREAEGRNPGNQGAARRGSAPGQQGEQQVRAYGIWCRVRGLRRRLNSGTKDSLSHSSFV